jgi:hypothetical protein
VGIAASIAGRLGVLRVGFGSSFVVVILCVILGVRWLLVRVRGRLVVMLFRPMGALCFVVMCGGFVMLLCRLGLLGLLSRLGLLVMLFLFLLLRLGGGGCAEEQKQGSCRDCKFHGCHLLEDRS